MSRKEIWDHSKDQAKTAVYTGAISYTFFGIVFWLAPYTTPVMLGAMQMVLLLTIVVPPSILAVGKLISVLKK